MSASHRWLFLLPLGLLVTVSLSSKRAEGAFASATTQAEFDLAVAQYIACQRNNTPTQCWNLVLDPFAIGEAIVSVRFPTDAVATGPDAIEVTGLNQYNATFDPINIEDLGENQSELHSVLVSHPGIPPAGRVNILDFSFEVNPGFTGDSARFIVEVSEATTVDLDTGAQTPLDSSMITQPDPVTISVPEPSTFALLAAVFFGLIPLSRALPHRRVV